MRSFFKSGFLLLLIVITATSSILGQDHASSSDDANFDIRTGSFLLPQRTQVKKYTHAIYLLYVAPPKDWTLDAVVAPMFNYTGKYSLPKGFNLQGGLSSLIISNRINAGPFWNYVSGKYHFGAGYQVAYNYGVLRQFGFNTVLTGWEQQPSVTFGYNFGKTAVTVRGDLYITSSINISEAGNTISSQDPFTNGYSILTSFEQRLTKKRVMSLGFKLNYLRYHIIAWPALPVSQYRYFMPEFQLGWNFN
ncbi:MAG TPA: hypothetical protein PLR06_04675 [Cyclobacteriaceae bacterium]|nr:hypothetical protein [Cyclobacteriaceae bacterium]